MPLELRKDRNGKIRNHWYGRYEANGKRYCVNLGVEIRGKIPTSLKQFGDIAFERSRAEAQLKLKHLIEEAHSTKNASDLLKRAYEISQGVKVKEVPLDDLAKSWAKLPRSRAITKRHEMECMRRLNKFVEFIQKNYRNLQYLSQITPQIAHHYLRYEQGRGIAPKTYNDILKLLRSAFEQLREDRQNPFKKIPTQESETIFRKPYTEEELQQILTVSENHPFIRPIIVLGIMTAMRRGDCCLLKWEDVDLHSNFIKVKTSKTGAMVEIPIWPTLRDELLKAQQSTKKLEGYAYPEQAKMYQENPDGITFRIKRVLNEAGFQTEDEHERDHGLRRASIRGFHAFRVTWVTLALNNNVPLEIIRRITGHRTTEIVLKH